ADPADALPDLRGLGRDADGLRLRTWPDRSAISKAFGGKGIRSGRRARGHRWKDRPAGLLRNPFEAREPIPGAAIVLGLRDPRPRNLSLAVAQSGGFRSPGGRHSSRAEP